jgi:hypothetical protein
VITGFQINFFTDNVPRLVAFYEALGFVERFRTPQEGPSDHVEVEAHGLTLGVTSIAAAHEAAPTLNAQIGGRGSDLVLWCDNVDRAHAAAVAAGASEAVAPIDSGGRLRMSWVDDPASNRVKFVQKLRSDRSRGQGQPTS